MKIFRVLNPIKPTSSIRRFEFHCYENACNLCKLRFLCFTNKDTIDIDSVVLWTLLRDDKYQSGDRNQARARKIFFSYMGK